MLLFEVTARVIAAVVNAVVIIMLMELFGA